MNPKLIKFIVTTAVTVGMQIHARRKLRLMTQPQDNALGEYVAGMINDGKVELDEFDKIALGQLGIRVVEEEEAE